MRDQHVEQADEVCGRGIDRSGHVGPGQQLQAAAVARHVAFQQGSVHAVQISGSVGNREHRLHIHVQRRMAQRSQVHQRSLSKGTCSPRARLTATVVAPLPPLALMTEKTLPRNPS